MKIRSFLLAACLLQASLPACFADEPITIPSAIAQQMTKGKKLELVWAAPDFDGSKGLKLGQIIDGTEDGNAGAVVEFTPMAMGKLIRPGSPYFLQLTITDLQMRDAPSGRSNARLEVEGQLTEAGKIKAAFKGYATETSGGNARDNARLALRTITFAMTKDLFSSELPKGEKSPAVIVPAPAPAPAASPALLPSQAPSSSAPGTAAPSVPAAPEKPSSRPVVAPTPSPAPVPATSLSPKPVPAAPQPVPSVPLYPEATVASMKRGKGLAQVWTSPAYDRAAGFTIGEVRYEVDTRNDGIDQYLPEALAEISTPDAPYTLQLRIVDLGLRTSGRGASNATLSVNGSIVAKNGTLMAAFTTRESVTGTGDLVDDCRTAARRVVLAIVKDLK